MSSVIYVYFYSSCRPMCHIGIHLITLLNVLVPLHLNAKCHEMTLIMMMLLIFDVTSHMSQNKVSDTIITHVTLNTVTKWCTTNKACSIVIFYICLCFFLFFKKGW